MNLTNQQMTEFAKNRWQNLDEFFKESYDLQVCNYPQLLKYTEPRRIYAPGGYASLKWVSAHLFSSLLEFNSGIPNERVHGSTSYGIALNLINNKVPIYFVSPQFARACAATELVEGFNMEDIHWPFQAMVFALPISFMEEFTGEKIGFVYSSEFKAGFTSFQDLAQVANTQDVISLNYNTWDEGRVGNFWGVYPRRGSIATLIRDVPYSDYTEVPTGKAIQEGEMLNKIASLIFKIVLVLNCRGHLLEKGLPAKIVINKKDPSKTKTEYWSPNLLGYNYIQEREKPSGGAGTKRAMYMRRGFLRNQAYGPRYSLHKHIWIQPVLCGQT